MQTNESRSNIRAARAHSVPAEWWESVRGVSHRGSSSVDSSDTAGSYRHNGVTWDFLIPLTLVLHLCLGSRVAVVKFELYPGFK